MSRVAVMMKADRADEQMSSNFGKTEWIMVADTESRSFRFFKNEGKSGKSVVETLISQVCTDVIFTEIGRGAFEHLKTSGIHSWLAPAQINGQQALQMFEHMRLRTANSPAEKHGCVECCCEKRADSPATSDCCG